MGNWRTQGKGGLESFIVIVNAGNVEVVQKLYHVHLVGMDWS